LLRSDTVINLFAKLFIKEYQNPASPSARQGYGMLCGAVGICLNLLLFGGKLLAGTLSGSIAVTADAFNNLSDAGSSIVTLIGFRLSGHKPDRDHPFGHGRIEYVAGLIVAMAILLMGFELAKTSITKILHPEPVEFSYLAMGILIVSICVKLYMNFYNRRIGKKIKSAAMMATAIDSLSDTIATSVVLLSMIFTKLTGASIDGICGALVALFILFSGYKAAKEVVDPLLGQAPEGEYVDKIRNIVLSHEDIIGVHDLVVHNYGPGRIMISLHAEVPASGDILALHDLVDNIEHDLRDELDCEAVIHMDPVATDDALTSAMREKVLCMINEIDSRLSMHDFRMVVGPSHTNLIFDVVVPFDVKISDAEVRRQICSRIQTLDGNCFAVINIDKTRVL